MTPITKRNFQRGDKVEYVTKEINKGFLEHIKNIPTEVEKVIYNRGYRSGAGLKIPLWHDPIDSNYFKKLT